MRFADLHLHTFHSDGTRSPREVVDLARRHRLDSIAITDHDNLAAFHEIRAYAAEQGVRLIPGVELSAEHRDLDVHILAYAFDPLSPTIANSLSMFREARRTRAERMVEKLGEEGFPIRIERVREISGEGAMGRPHVARALVEAGHVATISEAFDRLIGTGGPAYVPKRRFLISETIDLVREAGGVTSIAHPSLYPDSRSLVAELLGLGIDAVEVLHPNITEDDRRAFERIARSHGAFVTGGSDDHGSAKVRETIGSIRVPEELLQPILSRMPEAGTVTPAVRSTR